jgi:von Willebrand factor type A domain
MFRSCLAVAVALLFAFCAPARAQQNDCRRQVVPIHISTLDGSPLPELTPAHFEAALDDTPIRVAGLSAEEQPRRLVLLLDASGSIRGGTTSGWDATVEVAAQLLSALPPLEVGLAFFGEDVHSLVPPTMERRRLLDEVERLRQGVPGPDAARPQRTALWDSLLESARMFGPFEAGDVLYVITDGVDNFSQSRPPDVTQALLASGIRLFAFAIANRGFAYGTGDLERVVMYTGGVVAEGSASDWRDFNAGRRSTPIGSALYEQDRQILGFRRLELELPGPLTRPLPWRLVPTGLDENARKNIVLNYPATLCCCN